MPRNTSVSGPRKRRHFVNIHLWLGATLLGFFVFVAVFGPMLTPYDTAAQDLFSLMRPPSSEHWFGTDQVGRDIFSRIMAGTRYTLAIAVASVAIAAIGGVTLGVVAGYFGGWTDRIVNGIVDLLLTVPNLVLAIAIAAAVGASATGLTAAITASFIPPIARLVRARVIEIREEDYVGAAITTGMSHTRVLLRHVLPNASTVIIIEASLNAGQAVLVGSALGFLGLGVQPPAPEWGAMLGASREFFAIAPHLVVAPGLAISLLVLAFNTLGDGLRDHFDPNIQR